MAHSIFINKAENGFVIELLGAEGGLFVATRKDLPTMVADFANELVVPKPRPRLDDDPDETPLVSPPRPPDNDHAPSGGVDDTEGEEEYL